MQREFGKYDWNHFNYDSLAKDHIDRLTLNMIPAHSKVLELGCATGYHSQYLQEVKHCRVIGVDAEKAVAAKAKSHLQHLIIANLDEQKTWLKIKRHAPYDVVLASNVIEHLLDPWLVLEKIRSVLKPQGHAVIAVPNIAFWRSRLRLLQGKWEYEDYGIFDRTHTKFFTLDSLRQALINAGLKPIAEGYDPAGGAKWLTPILKLFPNAYAHQIVIKAVKTACTTS